MCKIISFGFVIDPGAYFRDSWNKLDFLIVIMSILDQSIPSLNLPFIKILRLLRILRPLKFLSSNINMKILVTTLMESVGEIGNMILVIFLFMLIWSIFGVAILVNKFGYCSSLHNYLNINQEKCTDINGNWSTYFYNFNDAISGLMTFFIIGNGTRTSWVTLMYFAMNGDLPSIGPSLNSN